MAWDYPSNFSNGTTVTGVGSLFSYMSYATGGWLAYAILFIIFSMSLLGTMMTSTRKGLAAAGFITFIFSLYFWQLQLINPALVFALIVITIVGAMGTKVEQSY